MATNSNVFSPPRKIVTSKEEANSDISIPLLASRFVDLANINVNNFMSVVDSDFYKSPTFNNNPNTADLDFAKYANLAPGDEQILTFSGQAATLSSNRTKPATSEFLANGSLILMVKGNETVNIGTDHSEIILGKVNQKIYNGTQSFYDGQVLHSYDALVTTYEHASVIENSEHGHTLYHYGELDVTRKGDETLTIYGQMSTQQFGPSETYTHGNSISISETISSETYDSVMTVKSVEGMKIETNAGLALTTLGGVETNVNGLVGTFSVKESLAAVVDSKTELAVLDAVAGFLGTETFYGKAFGACVRAGAAVFGIVRV